LTSPDDLPVIYFERYLRQSDQQSRDTMMTRATFNAAVFPYRKTKEGVIEYALLKRADAGFWQGVTGGGENNETPLETARRETFEETGISADSDFIRLDTTVSVPVTYFAVSHWPKNIYVIPMYMFGVSADNQEITLSHEHTEHRWMKYEQAYEMIKFDANKTALWELDRKLRGLGPRD
jgi:dATP pyrophosphohydrolase